MEGQNIVNNFLTTNTSNPWFVLLVVMGILQCMAQVPSYLSRAKISPVSDVIDMYMAKKAFWGLAKMVGGGDGVLNKMGGALKRNLLGDPNTKSVSTSGLITGDGKTLASFNNAGKNAMSGRGAPSTLSTTGINPAGGPGGSPGGAPSHPAGPAGAFGRPTNLAGAGTPPPTRTGTGAPGTGAGSGAPGTGAGRGAPGTGAGSNLAGTGTGSGASGAGRGVSGSGAGSGAAGAAAGRGMMAAATGTGTNAAPTNDGKIDSFKKLYGRTNTVNDANVAMMKKMNSGEVAFGVAAKGGHSIQRDNQGRIRAVKHRHGASEREGAALVQFAALADVQTDSHGREDPLAEKAVLDSVKGAHKFDPPIAHRASTWLSGGRTSQAFQDKEKHRLERAKSDQRDIGAMAYMKGQRGNAYTGYLRQKYGAYDQQTADWNAYNISNHDALMGGWNTAKSKGIETLVKLGEHVDADNIAVASHPAVRAMKMGEQSTAIPAVTTLVNTKLAQMGLPTPAEAKAQGLSHGLIEIAARDGIVARLTPQQVHAAHAIAQVTGGSVQGHQLLEMTDAVVNSTVGTRPADYEATVTNMVNLEQSARTAQNGRIFFNNVVSGGGSSSSSSSGTITVTGGGSSGGGGSGGGGGAPTVDYASIGQLSKYVQAAGFRPHEMEHVTAPLVESFGEFQDVHPQAFQPNSNYSAGGTDFSLGSLASAARDVYTSHGPKELNLPNIVVAQKLREANVPVQSMTYRGVIQYVEEQARANSQPPVEVRMNLSQEHIRACEAMSFTDGPAKCAEVRNVNKLATEVQTLASLKGADTERIRHYYQNVFTPI